jgi:nucleotide-binding universal stress UspA family protein
MQLHHIVVATDESDAGRSAVCAGLDLASRSSARLTVMRVVPVEAVPLFGAAVGGVVGPNGPGTALAQLERWLAPELTRHPSQRVELGIAFGLPGIEICRFAEQRGADLLILGRKHRSAVARLLVGDTADAVIRRSRVPCLFMEHGCAPLKHLLVALDGSERGMRVFATARDFAEAVRATLGVVTVEDVKAPPPVESVPPLPLTRSSRLWRELEPSGVRGGVSAPSEISVAIRQGRVVPEIVTEVGSSGADVLAFGCHRGGPSGILETGGTARHLVHTAPVSVLTVPL